MPIWLQAWLWGIVAGSALIIGAVVGYYTGISQRMVAGIMSFGTGVLISALSLNLMNEAFRRGGFIATSAGFLGGAIVYTIANLYLAKHGAKHRKRSGDKQPSEDQTPGSGLAIAIGSLLDDIPEAIAIGVSLIAGGTVGLVTVIAIFLSNVPEGLSSAAGMKKAGRSTLYVLGIWITVAVITSLGSLAGYVLFRHFSNTVISATIAVAAGAILAMLSDTMLPEAFEEAHDFVGIIVVAGFLAAFLLTKIQ